MHGFLSQMTGHLAMDVPRWLRYVRREGLILWGQQGRPHPCRTIPASGGLVQGKAHRNHRKRRPLAARRAIGEGESGDRGVFEQ
jgi:hypothetical protein